MHRDLIKALLIIGMLAPCGCAPVALAGGVIAMSLADSKMKREQARRRTEQHRRTVAKQQERNRLAAIERSRVEEAEQQAAAESEIQLRAAQLRRQHEENERNRLAVLERQLCEEFKQRRAREAERQRSLADATRQQLVAERMQAMADDRARQVLTWLEANLVSARWSTADFAQARESVAAAEKDGASRDLRRRLHVAMGLYAFLLDESAIAKREWSAAREMGATNGRIVAACVWTPGSIEGFNAAR